MKIEPVFSLLPISVKETGKLDTQSNIFLIRAGNKLAYECNMCKEILPHLKRLGSLFLEGVCSVSYMLELPDCLMYSMLFPASKRH